MSSVSYGAGGRGIPLAVDEPYGLSANIEYQRVHQRHTVLVTRITGYLNERGFGGGGGEGREGGGMERRITHTGFVQIIIILILWCLC